MRKFKDLKIAVAGTGARDIIRGCHNRNKGTAENETAPQPEVQVFLPEE